MNSIYNSINNIDNKYKLLFIILFFFIIFIINRSNLNIKGIVGIIISFIIIYIFIDKLNTKKNKQYDDYNQIIKDMPVLENIRDHKILATIYYDSRTLFKYDNINMKDSILNIKSFLEIYQDIKNNIKEIKYNYDIMLKHYYLCIDSFKSIEYSITNSPQLKRHFMKQLQVLDNELQHYLNEIQEINNNDIELNGYYVYKNKIDDKEIQPINLNEYY